MLNTVSTKPRLAPTVFVDVSVNDVRTPALVDTGSPATIISLDFVLKILADQRNRSLTPAQWKQETLKKFSAPEVTLKSYGGHCVDIVSQIPLQLQLGDKKINGSQGSP